MELAMKKLVILTALLLAPFMGAAPVTAAAPTEPNPNRPVEIIDGKGTFANHCAFPVGFEVTGKFKVIESPTGRTITTSPGQKVTLTNGTKSLSFVVTGVRRDTNVDTPTGPVIESVVTGRNIAVNGQDQNSVRPGLFLLVGDFNFAVTNTDPQREVRVFSGKGQVTDICAALA
jgi:hypothetical protein